MVCTRVWIWMKCEIKLQNKWNEDEAQRECVRAPKYNNTANRRASATRWTRWKYNYGKVYYINGLKWNKREKGREMCTGSSAMRRGVAQCGERHEIVSSSNAARARARHCKQLAPLPRRQEARPIRPCGIRSAFDQQIWRGELQWKCRNLNPILHQQKPSVHQQKTKSSPTKTKPSPTKTRSLPSHYQVVTNCNQVVTNL